MASFYQFRKSVSSWGTLFVSYTGFIREYIRFKRSSALSARSFRVVWRDRYPCLSDKSKATGFDRHYIYHLAWAARVLAKTRPEHHVDISSSLYFSSLISAFTPVSFFDYRPANVVLPGLECNAADLLSLPFASDSVGSLSCMHVVEHVGLGRYGDSLDPDGDLKAIAELRRVLAPGGALLIVVPIGGIPMVMFNAHRIYSYSQVMDYFAGMLLEQFALIPDKAEDGGLLVDASVALADAQQYGCGCFLFRKTSSSDNEVPID